MAFTDDQLLDFDASRYASYDEGRARELLGGVLYTDAVGGWDEPR
jgi:hypothetical protein